MSTDVKHLVARASRHDSEAITKLLERHLPDLRTFVRLRVGKTIRAKESCSDIVQSTCRGLLEDMGSFEYRDEPQFRCWLFKHALNKIVDKSRYYEADKRSPEREHQLGESGEQLWHAVTAGSPSRIAMGHELMSKVEESFDALPADYREAILLHRVVGLCHEDVAAEMGRSVGAVKNLVYRGIARLSLMLEES